MFKYFRLLLIVLLSLTFGCKEDVESEVTPFTKWKYTLMTPGSFKQFLSENVDAKVVDLRSKMDFVIGHYPGSLHIPTNKFMEADGYPKPLNQIEEALSEKGVNYEDKLVLLDNHGMQNAARVFWILNYLGVENVYVYTGKINKLQDSGFLTAQQEKLHKPSKFIGNLSFRTIVNRDILDYKISSKVSKVYDVRDSSEGMDTRIVGTVYLPWHLGRGAEQALYIETEEDKQLIEERMKGVASGHSSFATRSKESSIFYFLARNLGAEISHFPGGIKELVEDKRFYKEYAESYE